MPPTSARCTPSSSGLQDFGHFRQTELRPDAAVNDLVLPYMNGLELVRKLRSDEGPSRLPIIALTGRVVPLGHEVAIAAGCDRFLATPCSPSELLSEVNRLLVEAKSTTPAQASGSSGVADVSGRPNSLEPTRRAAVA